jgi:hypothetical protein
MALSEFEHAQVEAKVAEFINERRPHEELREKVDLAFRIEDSSIVIFEIRPTFGQPAKRIECPVAKTTFVKKTGQWQVFWQRADAKWHQYDPAPEVNTLEEFIDVVDEDEYGCFWG